MRRVLVILTPLLLVGLAILWHCLGDSRSPTSQEKRRAHTIELASETTSPGLQEHSVAESVEIVPDAEIDGVPRGEKPHGVGVGGFIGHLHESGSPLTRTYSGMIRSATMRQEVEVSDAGDIYGRIPAGHYVVEVCPGPTGSGPIGVVEHQFWVRPGETTEFDLDVGIGPTGAVAGKVIVDGQPQDALSVILVSGSIGRREVTTGQDGRFEFLEVPTGNCWIRAREMVGALPRDLCSESIQVEAGIVTDVLFEIRKLFLSVQVVDEDGVPTEGSNVVIMKNDRRGLGCRGRTNSNGRVYLWVTQSDTYLIEAYHPVMGIGRERVFVDGETPSKDNVVGLYRGIQAWGKCRFEGETVPSMALTFTLIGDDNEHHDDVWTCAALGGSFNLIGLRPGAYLVTATIGVQRSAPIRVTLPQSAESEIVLDFVPSER